MYCLTSLLYHVILSYTAVAATTCLPVSLSCLLHPHPTLSPDMVEADGYPRVGFCLTFLPKGEFFVTTVAISLALGGSLSVN